MRIPARVTSLFLISSSFALFPMHAQNPQVGAGEPAQSAPVGVVDENRPLPASNSSLTADYPVDQAGVLIQSSE